MKTYAARYTLLDGYSEAQVYDSEQRCETVELRVTVLGEHPVEVFTIELGLGRKGAHASGVGNITKRKLEGRAIALFEYSRQIFCRFLGILEGL